MCLQVFDPFMATLAVRAAVDGNFNRRFEGDLLFIPLAFCSQRQAQDHQ
jgi:hypothetical protein